ncbi:hypothetical protein PR202_gb27458 [Eleusine coracana subsp. coracana]|uniref:KIB1-4 beta-propeller domain-containing protein n=1 Tax=Eleusine coracana subsp. coracana TaxID=191504 RepID=A0AAV5FUH9_ELECO|nr:hypothetical protein PR202_gb27458 [Eleusine coracana subsp. coracana]
MVVLKECKRVESYYHQPPPVFKVLVLDERISGQWVETRDIGDAALFVGVNNSLCVDTSKCCSSSGRIRAGCVYYSDDELGKASLRLEQGQFGGEEIYRSSNGRERSGDYDLRDIGVYSPKDGKVGRVEWLPKHKCWPPPAWFTPSPSADVRVNVVARLPAELLAEIQNQLIFLDRVAFALVCRDSGTPMKPDKHPWLVVPTTTASTATLVSVADRLSADVPTCDPAMPCSSSTPAFGGVPAFATSEDPNWRPAPSVPRRRRGRGLPRRAVLLSDLLRRRRGVGP